MSTDHIPPEVLQECAEFKREAKALYDQRQSGMRELSLNWYSSKQRATLLRKCRKLASKIDPKATRCIDETHAMMYLDAIALRENVWFKMKGE